MCRLSAAGRVLRTPLARLRVAVELLGRDDRREMRTRIAKDIAGTCAGSFGTCWLTWSGIRVVLL